MTRAVILAAGRSERLGPTVDKLWMELGTVSVIEHAVKAFIDNALVGHVTVVTRKDGVAKMQYLLDTFHTHKTLDVVAGGDTRMQSVYEGVLASNEEFVAIHDAARPLVTDELITRVCSTAHHVGAACPALAVVDALVRLDCNEQECERVDRTNLFVIQTPQVMRRRDWLAGFDIAKKRGIEALDDTHIANLAGISVRYVEGDRTNIKLTHPSDVAFAKQLQTDLMNNRTRTGFGYDIHRLVPNRECWLGGVRFENNGMGLEGHSDADVLLHAICDALLGAAVMGDIGVLFPPSDPIHRNRPSTEFLEEVVRRVRSAGWNILHIDATVIAETPKVMPQSITIRSHIARVCSIPLENISIKATTNEGIGALGRGEGVAAHAVATLG